jgi:hypothetical protein
MKKTKIDLVKSWLKKAERDFIINRLSKVIEGEKLSTPPAKLQVATFKRCLKSPDRLHTRN